ncbi:cytochrome P450 [Macrolepiota fuliginosa MF-IS2]|uniref:Cytochrome P450 n=1 Tax=Macrolepiota fuliginosa MF-IS2 TaxID=1400762 RepID=A0A9P5XIX0_9AGAR|nr:cytochrome P450 [Macrolepiota fuliginosa MF-IS2]
MPSTPVIVASAGLLLTVFIWLRKSKASAASLPPGPKPVPLLGNVRDLTAKELWLPAHQWAKQYGDVVYLHVLGQGLVFLNSAEAAFDLLDKRGAIYSDKPQLVMTGELCGCKNMVAFTTYGDQSKRQRRLMHKAFGMQVIPAYYPLLQTETLAFLRRLVADPSEYQSHTRRYAGGLTLSVVYGYEAKSNDDDFLQLAEECVDLLANHIASGGGIWPVDIIPALQYLPDWAPGAGFKRKAEKWKAKMEEFVDRPFEFVKNSISTGDYTPSFCSTLLEDEKSKATEHFEFDLKWTANSMYSASGDTTITTVSHFFMAMLLHPEVLMKAQKEIDSVIGTDRLPTIADRSSLPYVQAVINESLRWGVPVPLNLPHRLMEDDVYRGMHIPKGSLVFGNIWAIMHDERLYPNPNEFKPERFTEEVDEELAKKRDPTNYVFGFGRRRCPGANLVDSSVWLLIANIIATMNINKPVDERGKTIEPEFVFENFIFRIPNNFNCDIRPRSQKALELITDSEFAL